MVVEFSIVPMGVGVGISKPLAKVMRMVDDSGLDYRAGPMCTAIEGDWSQVIPLIERCHRAMLRESPRVITTIKIDDRRGATNRLVGKVASVIRKSGRPLKT